MKFSEKILFVVPISVADPDSHYFGKTDSDPCQNEKLDPNPHQKGSETSAADSYHYGEDPNGNTKPEPLQSDS